MMPIRPGEIVRIEPPGVGAAFFARSPSVWQSIALVAADAGLVNAIVDGHLDAGRLIRLERGARAVVSRTSGPWLWVTLPGRQGEWCVPTPFAAPAEGPRLMLSPAGQVAEEQPPPETSPDLPGGSPCPPRRSGRRMGRERLRSLLRGPGESENRR